MDRADGERKIRRLIKELDITFVRPGKSFPSKYAELFDEIKEIGRSGFKKYKPRGDPDDFTATQTKERVWELVEAAELMFHAPTNEESLRMSCEPQVFKRFDAEIKCRNCRRQLWKTDYLARLDEPDVATRLEARLSDRTSCNCPKDTLVEDRDRFDDKGDTYLFAGCCSTPMKPDPRDRLKERGLPTLKPDRVFGIRATSSFRHYMQQRLDVRHSPFSADPEGLIYPFLISEAKSGRRNPGFESQETQTAFPLWTSLMLQERLRQVSGQPLDPLVWFMPYQGDIWKVSACVLENGAMHVHNLWLGQARDPDGAFQLLQIMDRIVDWARQTYRPALLSCLAGGARHVQRFSQPATSRQTTLEPDLNSSLAQIYPSVERPSSPQIEDSVMEDDSDEDNENHVSEVDGVESVTSEDEDIHPLLVWSHGKDNAYQWSSRATIRHVDMVRFEFEHLTVPEDPLIFEQWSQESSPQDPLNLIDQLHSLFCTPGSAINTTVNQILTIKLDWFNGACDIHRHLEQEDRQLLTCIQFVSYLDPQDWHVVRRLRYLTCSQDAADMLCQLSGKPKSFNHGEQEARSSFEKTRAAVKDVRNLSGIFSLIAVTRNTVLNLAPDDTNTWIMAPGVHAHVFDRLSSGKYRTASWDTGITSFRADIPVEIMTKLSVSDSIRRQLGIFLNNPQAPTAVVLKRDSSRSEQIQPWCLLVCCGLDMTDAAVVGDAIGGAERRGCLFELAERPWKAQNTDAKRMQRLKMADLQFLAEWRSSLMNGRQDTAPAEDCYRLGI